LGHVNRRDAHIAGRTARVERIELIECGPSSSVHHARGIRPFRHASSRAYGRPEIKPDRSGTRNVVHRGRGPTVIKETTEMFIAASDQMLLPLAVIDVSEIRSDRHTASPVKPAVKARVVGAVGANIVRLIPGVTRLPLGQPTR
jgi:hypothetical protein